MRAIYAIIGLGWVAFWIYWLVAAGGAKAGRARWGRFAGFRVVAVILVLLLLRSHALGRATLQHQLWVQGIGLVLFGAGLALAIWARVHLGRNWGMPMTEKVDPELVTTGPYRWIRNPIYSGLIVAILGSAIAVSWLWLLAVVLAGAYFVYSAKAEEGYMASQFPDTYPAYRQSTKMLIPFVL